MRNREIERELFIELINHQLKDHGVTYDDVKDNPQWYMDYQTTKEKEKEFTDYIIKRIQSTLHISKQSATKEASWFILQWGLTVSTKQQSRVIEKSSKKKSSSKN